jgi:hypothetical protein
MIVRWLWIPVATVLLFGCGEVSLNPFVETADAGTDIGNDDGGVDDDDGGVDDDDGGVDDDDGGVDDDDGGVDDELGS